MFAFGAFDIPQIPPRVRVIAATLAIALITALLLLLIFYKIEMPDPPIPPATELLEIELIDENTGGSGTNSRDPGGESQGQSKQPGSVAQEQLQPNPKPNPAPSNSALTDPDSDAPPEETKPQASNALKNALAKFNKDKSQAVISVKGGGQGNDPYGGGMGGKNGNSIGDGQGDPGKNGPGRGGNSIGNGRGRSLLVKPDVKNPTLEEGVVAMNVYFDRNGKVTRADVNAGRSTTLNPVLRATATQEAYKLRFTEDQNGPPVSMLVIEFNFTLK